VKLLELCWYTSSLGIIAERHCRKESEEADEGSSKVLQHSKHTLRTTTAFLVDAAMFGDLIAVCFVLLVALVLYI
jgi:hypothetical protein